jgi:hypothetical protein
VIRRAVVVMAAVALVSGCSGDDPGPTTATTPGASGSPAASASGTGQPSATTSVAPPTSLSPAATAVASGTLDQNKLAAAIVGTLRTRLGDEVDIAATCPAGVRLEAGATSRCGATVEGQLLVYTVTQSTGTGDVEFAPRSAVIDVDALERETAQQYGERAEGPWVSDCDTGPRELAYLVRGVGSFIGCTFTSAQGDAVPYTVTVTDLDGTVSWIVG